MFVLKTQEQGLNQDLQTGVQNWELMKFGGLRVSYPIYKNNHTNKICWYTKTKSFTFTSLYVPIVLYDRNFWNICLDSTNTENLTKYNWVSLCQND